MSKLQKALELVTEHYYHLCDMDETYGDVFSSKRLRRYKRIKDMLKYEVGIEQQTSTPGGSQRNPEIAAEQETEER